MMEIESQTFRIERWKKRTMSRARSQAAYLSLFSMPRIRGAQKGSGAATTLFQGKKPNWNRYFTTTIPYKVTIGTNKCQKNFGKNRTREQW